jgi:hypothetical protein
MSTEHWWNDTDWGNRSTISSTINPILTGLRMNLDLFSKRLVINHISHGGGAPTGSRHWMNMSAKCVHLHTPVNFKNIYIFTTSKQDKMAKKKKT